MSTRHLLAFRAVAAEGTFGRAAKRLGFTQSAVSQQVANLEQLVGQPLFDRPAGPRAPRLTAAGELLLGHADALIGRFEEAERDLDRFARGVSGNLTIGTFQSISARLLPTALQRLHVEAPDVEIDLVDQDMNPGSLAALIESGDIDLAFVIGDVDPACESRYLGADPHVAIVSAGEPDGCVSLLELSGKPMVGQPPDDHCGLIIDHDLERMGVTPHYVFRSHDNGAVQGMVAAGVGIAIMPLLAVDTSHPGTSVRITEPELAPRRLSIVWSRNRTPAPIASRFVDIVDAVCAEQLNRGI